MGPGQVLGGRYRIRYQAGSGGYGPVWRAYDQSLGVPVAIESVGMVGPEGMGRVRQLVRTLARLRDQPHLAVVHDIVEAGGRVWRVTPLLTGPTLTEVRAEHGQLTERQVREVAQALLAALEAMHRAGVVHGDVRPGNIRWSEGRWVLLPGLDTMVRGFADETTDSGTWMRDVADYVSPELVNGERRGPGSDLFSLGATLYELIEGYSPFHRSSVPATMHAVLHEEPPPLGPRLGQLGLLVDGLLAKAPERRLTVDEARAVLARAGGRPAVAAAQHTAVGRAPTVGRPSRGMGAALPWGLFALVLAVALVSAGQVHVSAGDLGDAFGALLPWALFALGLCVLAVQVRAALARRRLRARLPLWRWYVRSLAPPARWTDEERARRQAAAEQALDKALLDVDRWVACAAPDGPGRAGRGARDV
ncbi:serine/threonine-protein kinase [Streptomyces sp. NPDC059009]|uniref:serine/threonine-protein kinase n=1 Tax=Streptomyces sp. NPDC059009 TaxID=3346694 RepID=UPI0036930211